MPRPSRKSKRGRKANRDRLPTPLDTWIGDQILSADLVRAQQQRRMQHYQAELHALHGADEEAQKEKIAKAIAFMYPYRGR